MLGVSGGNEGLMNGPPLPNKVLEELRTLDIDLLPIFDERDAASRLITLLPTRYPLAQIAQRPGDRMWELVGLFFLYSGRIHEALEVFWGLYQQKIAGQATLGRVHKGMPLCRIGECFLKLGFPVHAKRYLMLTLCEDALRECGIISPNTTGAYFRLIWEQGLPNEDFFRRYGRQLFELDERVPGDPHFARHCSSVSTPLGRPNFLRRPKLCLTARMALTCCLACQADAKRLPTKQVVGSSNFDHRSQIEEFGGRQDC